MTWKAGDWVVFDLSIGQIKEVGDGNYAIFSDGSFKTSGRLADRFRPLTLANKSIVETFEIFYHRLNEIDGERGFNYPDISQYFAQLARDAIDTHGSRVPFDKAQQFVSDARSYQPEIQGVRLFRQNLRAARS